jgi:hypothetical protein
VAEIEFYSEEAKKKLRELTPKKQKKELAPSTSEEQSNFLQAIASTSTNVVGLCGFAEYTDRFISTKKTQPKPVVLPPSLRSLYKLQHSLLNQSDLHDICISSFDIPISAEQISYIEELTHHQSSSLVWHDQRVGRITGSTAHTALHTNQSHPAPSLIRNICTPSPKPLNTPACKWGREHEDTAFDLYSSAMCEGASSISSIPVPHLQCSTRKAGLFISPDHPFIGASPDGLVECECCGKGVVEIKCPYSHFNKTIADVVADDPFFCLNTSLQLKKSHSYYTQVQVEMYVTSRTYTDFIVWTTRLPCL